MDGREAFLLAFWSDVAAQKEAALRLCFTPDAVIQWHSTNERFSVEEYIRANCEYPGKWRGCVERMEHIGNCSVTATRVDSVEDGISFHAVSFFTFRGEKIASLDEYWGDDGPAPQWRQALKLGTKIHP